MEYFEKSKELTNNFDEWVEFGIGITNKFLGEYSKAVECFEKIKEYGKYPGSIDLELAEIYSEWGEKEKTLYHLDEVKKYLNLEDEAVKKRYQKVEENILKMGSFLM